MEVLIVDDDEDICMILELIFKKKGWNTTYVTSGEKCLAWLKERQPDVVFLDLLMPSMSGDAVLKEMRRDQKTTSTPVIFLTAKDVTPKERAELIAMGAQGVYTKPVDPLHVIESATQYLNK
ncbi:MAG: response regulator [Chlamydiales bacterium]|nr:response regulator [Chlamydiales bacterium]